MPKLSKKVLSLFLRTRCERQFRLHLHIHSKEELEKGKMPKPQVDRPGLGFVEGKGFEYQESVTRSLQRAFGEKAVVAEGMQGRQRKETELEGKLLHLTPHQFVIEAKYVADTPTFREEFELDTL